MKNQTEIIIVLDCAIVSQNTEKYSLINQLIIAIVTYCNLLGPFL